uniref:Ion transport domain-containing protein n=1 Tax=Labrus bergylta TaxID=56723 RepID=A0A3Q3NBJ6_9LABR
MTDAMRRKEVKERGVAHSIQQQEENLPYPHMASVVFLCLKQSTKPRSCTSLVVVAVSTSVLFFYVYDQVFEVVIFALFLLEMVIKMVAIGIPGYLCSNWNKVMDFVLAHYGYRWQFFQALRPMRLFGRIQSMQILVTVLVDTLPMLGNVLFLNMLVIHIFAVVGVQLWGGQLRNRCFLGEDIPTEYNVSLSPYYLSKLGEMYPFICSPDNKGGMQRCSDIPAYKEDGETCSLAAPLHRSAVNAGNCVNWNQYYNVCRPGADNPYMGAISFDNICFSWIAIFQVVTLEGWAEIMFFVMDAHSFWNCLLFIFVTIVSGSKQRL